MKLFAITTRGFEVPGYYVVAEDITEAIDKFKHSNSHRIIDKIELIAEDFEVII